jgi:hypothetical protein
LTGDWNEEEGYFGLILGVRNWGHPGTRGRESNSGECRHLSFTHKAFSPEITVVPGGFMKARVVLAAFLCFALLSAVGIAAAQEYQSGKILKVEKQASQAPSGGTDAPMSTAATSYLISIQLDGKVYVCKYKVQTDQEISWIEGKDVQARVKGKAMFVKKLNGKEEKGSIVSTR